jgi:membrane-bound ClpP family serine protease
MNSSPLKLLFLCLFSLTVLVAASPVPPPPPRIIEMKGEIDQEMADRIIADLALPGSVEILINSPGGSVFAGLDIMDAIKAHQGPVVCRAFQLAASMAANILVSCPSREATPATIILFHSASSGVRGQSPDLDNASSLLKALSRALAYNSCLHIPGIPLDVCMENQAGIKEWWIASLDLLNIGGLDRIAK